MQICYLIRRLYGSSGIRIVSVVAIVATFLPIACFTYFRGLASRMLYVWFIGNIRCVLQSPGRNLLVCLVYAYGSTAALGASRLLGRTGAYAFSIGCIIARMRPGVYTSPSFVWQYPPI